MSHPFRFLHSRIVRMEEFSLTSGLQSAWSLFYLKEGEFVVDIDGQKHTVHPGDCFLFPSYIHFSRNVVDPIVFIFVRFAYNDECPFSLELPYGKIELQDRDRFLSSILTLEKLLDSDDAMAECLRQHLLEDILFQIYLEHNPGGLPSQSGSYQDPLLDDAAAWIDAHLDSKILIDELCHSLCTNASTLNYKFRQKTGMSIGQFITAARMKKARQLLIGTTYDISHIAARCGYENIYYFSNAFKKYHHISPAKFRK